MIDNREATLAVEGRVQTNSIAGGGWDMEHIVQRQRVGPRSLGPRTISRVTVPIPELAEDHAWSPPDAQPDDTW